MDILIEFLLGIFPTIRTENKVSDLSVHPNCSVLFLTETYYSGDFTSHLNPAQGETERFCASSSVIIT